MPMMWLKAHAEALPELQGEECFRAAETISVGAGKLKKNDHDKVVKRWNSAIGRETGPQKPSVGKLLSLGIKVRDEPR
jgi:hypothetical protein